MFKVIGISTLNGKTKVRFANDLVSRVKILVKEGHQDINLMELPQAMTKLDAVNYLKTTSLVETPQFAEAIQAAYEKYSTAGLVKISTKPSLDAIKARAGIVATPEVA